MELVERPGAGGPEAFEEIGLPGSPMRALERGRPAPRHPPAGAET
jgi:hypothetical protein